MELSKDQRILDAAHRAFLSHGFKRITMQEIAEAAEISRPGLYLSYKSKEEVFSAVIRRNMEAACDAIVADLAGLEAPGARIRRALDLWAVRSFEQTLQSPEARELLEAGHEFAREAFEAGYRRFEAVLADHLPEGRTLGRLEMAHLLTSAVRGFKQVASTGPELQLLITRLLELCGL